MTQTHTSPSSITTYVILNARINYAHFFAQEKFINGKEQECRLAMKAVMNVGAVELLALMKILNGNILRAAMESFFGLPNVNGPVQKMHWFFILENRIVEQDN